MAKKKITPDYENLLETFKAENDPLVEMLKFLLRQLIKKESCLYLSYYNLRDLWYCNMNCQFSWYYIRHDSVKIWKLFF